VFDGNFYHKEQINDLIKNLNFKNFVFTLTADLKTCIKRDKERKNSYGKEAACAVYKLVSAFDYGFVINTNNKNSEQVVNEIIKQLPKN